MRQIMVREISTLMVWDRGAKCRACGTKLQHADEQIIQGNIKAQAIAMKT